MKDSAGRQLAPIAELRLRQWARRNYIPADLRSDDQWHPVVLDEMRRCDAERAGLDTSDGVPGFDIVTSSGIVPLEPSRHEGLRVDAAHDDIAAPRFAQQDTQQPGTPQDRAPADSRIPYYA